MTSNYPPTDGDDPEFERRADDDRPSPETAAETALDLGRRGFMGAAAVGLGAAFGIGQAAADGHEDPTIPDVLNYALTLERLEAAYYRNGLASSGGVFTEREVERSAVAGYFDRPTLRYSTYQHFEDIRDHEIYHVAALEGALDSLGADVTAPETFQFPDGVYDSVENFVGFAQVVEDLGVSAYAGAAPYLAKAELEAAGGDVMDLQLTPVALGIHSVEARHAGYLRTLTLQRPWPFGTDDDVADVAVDDPRTMEEVLDAADDYLLGETEQTFTVRIENESSPGTIDTDRADGLVPLSPGAYAVFTGPNPAFAPGDPANEGTEDIAEDGMPGVLAESLAADHDVTDSGSFTGPGGPIVPGSPAEFSVVARPGQRFTLETMFVQSNDWFYGLDLGLFDGGTPVSGDVTDHLTLYDAGTEADTAPGTGPDQVLAQSGPDTGPDDEVSVIRTVADRHPEFDVPPVEDVIRVTITPE